MDLILHVDPGSFPAGYDDWHSGSYQVQHLEVVYNSTQNNHPTYLKPSGSGLIFQGFWTSAFEGYGVQVYDADMKYVPGTYWSASGEWKYGSSSGSLKIYSQWKFVLTIDPNGGTFNGSTSTTSIVVVYGETTGNNLGNSAPTRSGWTFLGWFASGTNTKVYDTNNKCLAGTQYWTDSYANGGKWQYRDADPHCR